MVDKPSLCSSTYFLFCSSSNAAVPLLQMLTPSQQEGQDYEEGWFDNLFGDVEARLLTAPDRDPTGVCIMQDKIPASSEADEALRAWVRTLSHSVAQCGLVLTPLQWRQEDKGTSTGLLMSMFFYTSRFHGSHHRFRARVITAGNSVTGEGAACVSRRAAYRQK